MSLIERLSNTYSAAKRAWFEPAEKQPADQKPIDKKSVDQLPKANINFVPPPINIYYVDTLAPAGEGLPQLAKAGAVPPLAEDDETIAPPPPAFKGIVETRLEKMSAEMNAELAKGVKDFDKLQAMIYKVIMMMMRAAAKSDLEQIHEYSVKIKKQAYEIQATYNTWQGMTITVISAGVSIGGGVAGLSPFIPGISPQTAQYLVQGSQAIGTAGTGLSSIGSMFDKRSEGNRSVMQTFQRIMQEKEEEGKTRKQAKTQLIQSTKAAEEEAARNKHQATSAAAAA